jgi:8-oxo-dGTP diphosphatase
MQSPLEFGEKIDGVYYQPRPGAYAVIREGAGLVAVLKVRERFYLPGGGIDAGETAEAALHREVREETGHAIEIVRPIGFAIEHVAARREGYFAKHCHFFEARLGAHLTIEHEADHELVWLPLADAIEQLTDGSQSWAVSKVAIP